MIEYFCGIFVGAGVDKQHLQERTVLLYNKYKKFTFPKSRWPHSLDLLDDVHFSVAFNDAFEEVAQKFQPVQAESKLLDQPLPAAQYFLQQPLLPGQMQCASQLHECRDVPL